MKSLQIKCIIEWGQSLLSNVFAAQQIIGSIVRHWMASRVAIVSRVTWYKLGATWSGGGIIKSPPGDIVSIFGACESMAVRERYQFCLFAFPSPVICLKFLPHMLPLNTTYMYIIPCFESFFWIIDPDLMHYWGRQWPCCDNCVVKMLLTRKTENGQDPSR